MPHLEHISSTALEVDERSLVGFDQQKRLDGEDVVPGADRGLPHRSRRQQSLLEWIVAHDLDTSLGDQELILQLHSLPAGG